MPETIYKLQPNRTIQLRGFSDLGAAAALHSATDTGFKVSGVFRDPADFCVLTLWDSDNFFEHPALRYLPDSNFDRLKLTFDVHYSGLRNLDSPRYRIIDWPFLDAIRPDGSKANIELFKDATLVSGNWSRASARFTIVDNGLRQWDHVTIWYLNQAFDFLVPELECGFVFTNRGAGFVHSITVGSALYAYTEQTGDLDVTIAQRLVDAMAASQIVVAARVANQVNVTARPGDGQAITVVSTANPESKKIYAVSAASIAAELARQCNATDWHEAGADIPLTAEAVGNIVTFTAAKPGVDGNALSMYSVSKNPQLTTLENVVQFAGGDSDATWRVSIDFRARGIPQARQMWLTFAPPIACGKPFEAVEWEAAFSNWTVEGPPEVRRLQVAGPGSVRVEESSSACEYRGAWADEHGFYSEAYAKVAKAAGSTVTIAYDCGDAHEVWLGTSVYADRGVAEVLLDGVAQADCDTHLDTGADPAVITRRRIAERVAPGRHTVVLRTKDARPFYFDFLEAVVRSDVPDDLPARPNISPALDYSTDHTYKLPPARTLWAFEKLGFAGPMNEYIGVFWWNQRSRTGAEIPRATITFTGEFKYGDQVWLNIAGTWIGKSVFATDTNATIARHFACYVNSTFVGLWAVAQDNVLTLTSHSPTRDFQFDLSRRVDRVQGSTGDAVIVGMLRFPESELKSKQGRWLVDPSQAPGLNRGARDWHADFFRECKAHDRELVVAASMELVMPPDEFPARYYNGDPVKTDVGYGSDWWSSHCAFNSAMLAYQKDVFGCLADLMADAGLRPEIQFGEFCWWYFRSDVDGSMALYDTDTREAAEHSLGRRLVKFTDPDEDPAAVNGGADALFLRNRLRDHVRALVSHLRSAHPDARFEVLFPYDVNYPRPAGKRGLGGRLLRFVNFPAEWERVESAGFERLKMEGLDWGALTRDLDLVRDVMEFPVGLGWPLDSVRYMMPIFNGGCPWESEYRIAKSIGIPAINLWAFDHVCIFGLPVLEPGKVARAYRF